jgi:hypothetical protein
MKYVLLLISVLLSGCATMAPPPPRVDTVTTTFAIPDHMTQRGSLAVQSPDPALNKSLEFAHYKLRFEERLQEQGYTIEPDVRKAKYIAFVTYGVDNGQTETITSPVYGQMGSGPVFSSGVLTTSKGKTTPYSGISYGMPMYGMVGTVTDNVTRYTRVIAMDIVEANSLKGSEPKKVYEFRAKSIGMCGNFLDVFEPILTGLFQDWPGVPGRVKSSSVVWQGRCTGR